MKVNYKTLQKLATITALATVGQQIAKFFTNSRMVESVSVGIGVLVGTLINRKAEHNQQTTSQMEDASVIEGYEEYRGEHHTNHATRIQKEQEQKSSLQVTR